MAKYIVRNNNKKKSTSSGGGIVKLKIVVKSFLLGRNKSSYGFDSAASVPEDVKKGHFAVIAEGRGGEEEEEAKRFVLPLSCLTNPIFLRLLEQAAEEYGFEHEGAVTIPCRPCELERILAQQWIHQEDGSDDAGSWNSCDESMVSQNYYSW